MENTSSKTNIYTHDGAEMLFKIQDANTLVGDSIFNENTYKKSILPPEQKTPTSRVIWAVGARSPRTNAFISTEQIEMVEKMSILAV